MKARNTNIELLRVILMFGVVLNHCLICGPFADKLSVAFMYGLTLLAVPTFVAISGCYGVRFKLRKVVQMLALYLFCGIFCTGVYFALGKCGLNAKENFLTVLTCRYWFLEAYLWLMVSSVVINPVMDWAASHSRLRLIGVTAVIVGLHCATVLLDKNQFSYFRWGTLSALNVVVIYTIGRCASVLLRDVPAKRILFRGLIPAVGLMALNLAWVGYKTGFACDCMGIVNHGFEYRNPLIMAVAILLVIVISKCPRQVPGGRFILGVSASLFAIYMLSDSYAGIFCSVAIERALPIWLPKVLVCLIAAVVAFVGCLLVDYGRRLVLKKLNITKKHGG